MKRSEQYHMAQIAVLQSNIISYSDKLIILKTLMDEESIAKWSETHNTEGEDNAVHS